MTRRLTMKMATFAMLILIGTVAAACSSSGSSSTAPPGTKTPFVATGSLHCKKVKGTVQFSPPLTTAGGRSETTTVVASLGDCTPAGSTDKTKPHGTARLTLNTPSNACSSLTTSQAATVNITWRPKRIEPTSVSFTGFDVTSQNGNYGFTLPGTGHTASLTGSFAGTDGGATSIASIFSDQGSSQILAACGSSSGLSAVTITSGTVTLG